jgi:hypothetical protein
VSERPEPALGWRLWRVRGGVLRSWAVDYAWEVGENRASCFAPWRDCPSSPGRRCRCGFWALYSPHDCLRRARDDPNERVSVLGLVRAWGEVAIHGQEGFRAERASVACLFTDWPWDEPMLMDIRGATWMRRFRRRFLQLAAPETDPSRLSQLQAAAARYAVPLVSLRHAVDYGLLQELGTEPDTCRQVAAWLGGAKASGD